ncbi:MAG: hypothetical protein K2M43_01900, partial [Mycoplasmoidaceae bacterium]|nr:hypothetical protein [Mycoplasmoidaceae bacterium]
ELNSSNSGLSDQQLEANVEKYGTNKVITNKKQH